MVLIGHRMKNILVYCVCLFPCFILSETKVSTACYGTRGFDCTEHKLICRQPLVISITNMTFGYRKGCRRVGVSSCNNNTCCRKETGDCFTPYNQTLLLVLQQTCNDRSGCILNSDNGLVEISRRCYPVNRFHSYSKIEYQYSGIVTESTTNTVALSGTEATTVGGVEELPIVGGCEEVAVVGGVLGTVIVICIAIIVVLVIYFNRKLSKQNSESNQNDHQYDSAPSRSRDESPAVYNSLNTGQQNGGQQQNTANGQTHSSNNSQYSNVDNGDTQINQNNQENEHAYELTLRGVTDQPTVLYDSLNTREQTGYYNMGNINTVNT